MSVIFAANYCFMSGTAAPALRETNFTLPGQTAFYRGKVRDVYTIGDQLLMVASDRISAFDHILPRAIPHKGQVLNQMATHFLEATRDICPNWLTAVPDPNVAAGHACEPYRIEMVIRGYLTGHAWRTYRAGGRTLCGVALPEGMRENDPFPRPYHHPRHQGRNRPRRGHQPRRDHRAKDRSGRGIPAIGSLHPCSLCPGNGDGRRAGPHSGRHQV